MFKVRRSAGSKVRIGRTLAGLALAGTVLGCVGVAPAGAQVTPGPNAGGRAYGSASCDTVHHTIQVTYDADPETWWGMNGIIPVSTSTPEWVDVYAYVKLATSSSWGAPVAHGTVLANAQGTLAINTSLRGIAGRTYNVAFYVRVAYPGSKWTTFMWDPYTLYYDSFSGSLFAPYNFCEA
jgi:hypothetical protein